jgi:DMSO/TMAO reductase YedYZ molybdopterin-dependent catalytic subunit
VTGRTVIVMDEARARPERRWRAAIAGVIAAGVALAAGQVPSAIAGEAEGPVTAVGNAFVDRFAGSLKEVAVALFGQNDKVALVVGIVVISLLLGGALGLLALRSFALVALGFVAFAVVGLIAVVTDTSTGAVVAVVSALTGAGAGIGVLALLMHHIGRGPDLATTLRRAGDVEDPRVRTPDRRTFLGVGAAAGAAAALTAAGARSLRGRSVVDAQREALELPDPVRGTPLQATDLEVPGLSPYVTPNEDFYRIDTALVVPRIDASSWRLRVGGLVDEPFELTFDELLDMEMVEEPVTIACVSNEVGGDLVGNAVWLGVPLAELLQRAGAQDAGSQIVGRSTDGFTVGFPTDAATDGRIAMVAVGMNGEPLPADHGYPARLIVAGLYGYVSATKWLTEIELTRFEDFDAYWVPRGWSKIGPVKTQSRIDVPRRTVDAGTVPIAGVAWAPHVGIAAVEVSIDDGPWLSAELHGDANDSTWAQWVHEWDATPGTHTIRCRATDAAGETQTAERRPPAPDGATGLHTVQVTVRG